MSRKRFRNFRINLGEMWKENLNKYRSKIVRSYFSENFAVI